MNWAVPGETGEEAFILGTVGISRIGLENGSKSLDLYFLTDYQILHLTHYSSRFFLSPIPQGLTRSLQSPRAWCPKFPSVLLLCCLVGTDFTFLAIFCENCSNFAGSGDFETGTALPGFSALHLDP